MRSVVRWLLVDAIVLAVIFATVTTVWIFLSSPVRAKSVRVEVAPDAAFDVGGGSITAAEITRLPREPSPAEGAVRIAENTLKLGKKAFYEETFGNEVFLTEVLGILSGPLSWPQFARAVAVPRTCG